MIITSLLDTDLYKFTMMQVVLHQFPGAQVEYRFKCRNPGVNLAPHAAEIRATCSRPPHCRHHSRQTLTHSTCKMPSQSRIVA